MARIIASLCATGQCEGLDRATSSLERHGIPYNVYGMGMPWVGNGMKQVAALATARRAVSEHYEFVLSLDGYDTLCLADEWEIVGKFLALSHPMVICGEMNCWPDPRLACRYPPAVSSSPFRFINAGAYIAYTGYLLAMMDRWGITESFEAGSDQGFLTERLLSDPGCIHIDSECNIFQALCGLKPDFFVCSGGRVVNPITHRIPCILHGNGHVDMSQYWGIQSG